MRNLGRLELEQGQAEQAAHYFEASLRLAGELGDRRVECATHCANGILNFTLGRFDSARDHYEAAIRLGREVGAQFDTAAVMSNLGVLEMAEGNTERAQALHEEALAIFRDMDDGSWQGFELGCLSEIEAQSGHFDKARALLDRADEVQSKMETRWLRAEVCCQRGTCELLAGDRAAAATALAEAETHGRALAAGPRSEVGQRIAKLRKALAEG